MRVCVCVRAHILYIHMTTLCCTHPLRIWILPKILVAHPFRQVIFHGNTISKRFQRLAVLLIQFCSSIRLQSCSKYHDQSLIKYENKSMANIDDRKEENKYNCVWGTLTLFPSIRLYDPSVPDPLGFPWTYYRCSSWRKTTSSLYFVPVNHFIFLFGDCCVPRSVRFPIEHDAWRPLVHWNADRQVLNRDKYIVTRCLRSRYSRAGWYSAAPSCDRFHLKRENKTHRWIMRLWLEMDRNWQGNVQFSLWIPSILSTS